CVLLALVLGHGAAADPVSEVRALWSEGRLTVETEGRGVSADSAFAIASVGKTMTAVAVLSLVDDGLLSLDAAASEWLPNAIVDGFDGLEGITVRHLLAMESGLPDYYAQDYLEDALDDPDAVQRAEIAVSYAYGLDRSFRPGTGFEYSNTNYVLLGLIAEAVTGQTYAKVMQERVLDPAGMTGSFVFGARALPAAFVRGHQGWRHVRDYYAADGFGDGGVISTAPDLVAFYRAVFIDRTLLSEAALAQMIARPGADQYGLGIAVDGQFVGHSGADLGFSSEVIADLESGDIAVMLVAEDNADTDWVFEVLEP
ncbi:MAG: serine hydrolase domain-containing protein, partial [Pseudomonadota bacterium]